MADEVSLPSSDASPTGPPAPGPVGAVPGPQAPPPNLSTPGAAPQPNAPLANSPTAKAVQNIPVAPQQVQMHHENMLGKAVKSLMGSHMEYSVGPDGKTIATPVKEKPGNLFRSILAGAILGSFTGSKEKSFAGGVGAGGTAVQQKLEEQDKQRYERAQEQFKNQQTIDERNDRKTLLNAQVAHYNALTLHENMMASHENFDFSQKVSTAGAARMSPYREAGIQMAATDVPESQMHDMIKTRPEMSTYHWEPTGVKVVAGEPGKDPHYELTYSAVDPNEKVKVTQDLINQFKKDGMEKYYPNLDKVLKAGQPMDAQDYMVMVQKDKELANDTYLRSKQKSDLDKEQSEIKKNNAEAAKALHELHQAKLETKQSQLFSTALDELNKVEGDFSKLSPKSKLVIGESTTKLIGQVNQGIKEALAQMPPDEEKAKELMGQRDQLINLSTQAFTNRPQAAVAEPSQQEKEFASLVPAGNAAVKTVAGQLGYVPEDRLDSFLEKNKGAKVLGRKAAPVTEDTQVRVETIDGVRNVPLKDVDATLKSVPGAKVAAADKNKYDTYQKNKEEVENTADLSLSD